MNKHNFVEEMSKINDAIDEFASEMKLRMRKKLDQGYTGWDSHFKVSSNDLRDDLEQDAYDMNRDGKDDKAVDIANRAMILWYRKNKI